MPDKDPDGPSLELPSFGFGRKGKKKDTEPEAVRPEVTADPEPAVETAAEPEPEAATIPVPALGQPAPPAAPERVTQALDPIATPPAASTPAPPPRAPRAPRAPDAAESTPPEPERTTPLLGLGALPASLLTGVVVGLLTALLAYASQRLCEVVRSTSSCGGAGVLLLLAILVGMTLLGAALLRAFVVPEAGSTSVLAMGLLAVLVLLFLIDAAFSPAMFVVIPVLAAGCYAAAHLVTMASTSSD
ncbi:hypothetical protein [Nocardioides sp. InS609-2]|uniref:hypothetical protein n=1 Tax=Nocardioides sp. InS609-2 TaxID=2760705 RepID=UPI0020BDA86E|nr:hypothetical protein [Nocardioides sp. InS609-2]